MSHQWSQHAWIFADNGYALDIHVRDAKRDDWLALFEHFNAQYDVKYRPIETADIQDQIPLELIKAEFEQGPSDTMRDLSLIVDGINIGCGIFSSDKSEFFFTPTQVKDQASFDTVLDFMFDVAKVTGCDVTLTPGNVGDLPYITISVHGINFPMRPSA